MVKKLTFFLIYFKVIYTTIVDISCSQKIKEVWKVEKVNEENLIQDLKKKIAETYLNIWMNRVNELLQMESLLKHSTSREGYVIKQEKKEICQIQDMSEENDRVYIIFLDISIPGIQFQDMNSSYIDVYIRNGNIIHFEMDFPFQTLIVIPEKYYNYCFWKKVQEKFQNLVSAGELKSNIFC